MPRKWWVLASVACGTFMATLDSSIVNIALPSLSRALMTSMHKVQWVVIAYLLVITCIILPIGKISDQIGRKKIFISGFSIFTLGSVLCGVSGNIHLLIYSRILQGVGAAMLFANGPAIITTAFRAEERGKGLGTLAMVVSFGLISGPSIGGFLITSFGWPSIFLVNLPIGLLGIFLSKRYIEPDPPPSPAPPFDWKGSLFQSFLLISIILLVDPPGMDGHFIIGNWLRWVLIGCVIILCVFFVRMQKRTISPVVDISLFSNRTFWSGNLAGLLTFIAYSSVNILIPFFLDEILHFSPRRSGFYMTSVPLTILIIAPISGRISDRIGSRGLSALGSFIGMIGLLAMSGVIGAGLNEEMDITAVIWRLSCIGLALGLFQSPNNSAIMGSVPTNRLGSASAILATVRNLGLALGTGISSGVFNYKQEQTGSFLPALHFTHAVAAVFSFLAFVVCFGKKKGKITDW